MDVFSLNQLSELIGEHACPCVSLYCPTHVSGREQLTDRLQLKHLVEDVEEELKGEGWRSSDAHKFALSWWIVKRYRDAVILRRCCGNERHNHYGRAC